MSGGWVRKYHAPMGTGYLGLTVSVLGQARRDMERGSRRYRRARRDAVVWLATSEASLWFEASGIDQTWGLERMGWARHARALLESNGLDPPEQDLVRRTLSNLQHGRTGIDG